MEVPALLNAPGMHARLRALAGMARPNSVGLPHLVNNHIHTTFSFSPYSPTAAVYAAAAAGLATAGIMDHDSLAGAEEFRQASALLGLGATCGMELRVRAQGQYVHARINNPDQNGIFYMAMHGVPRSAQAGITTWFAPYRAAREARNLAMVEKLNAHIKPTCIRLRYRQDVRPLSQFEQGGSVTERHILYALCLALTKKLGRGEPILRFLQGEGVGLQGAACERLADCQNPLYEQDLLMALKGGFVAKMYVDAGEECPNAQEAVEVCRKAGAIPAYAYLGDVSESVTGDKRPQAFEDGYLDQLFAYLAQSGFQGVTYMPARNTRAQITRVQALCRRHGFLQISGEDINSPRQAFVCPALEDPIFSGLVDAAWALVYHEHACVAKGGLFSPWASKNWPALQERVRAFADMGRGMVNPLLPDKL